MDPSGWRCAEQRFLAAPCLSAEARRRDALAAVDDAVAIEPEVIADAIEVAAVRPARSIPTNVECRPVRSDVPPSNARQVCRAPKVCRVRCRAAPIRISSASLAPHVLPHVEHPEYVSLKHHPDLVL